MRVIELPGWVYPRRLLDHLVGAGKQRFRDREAERLGGGQVDDKIESGRELDRNVAGLRAAQNLVHILGCAPEQSWKMWSVRQQPSGLHELAGPEHRRQPRG